MDTEFCYFINPFRSRDNFFLGIFSPLKLHINSFDWDQHQFDP